MTSIGTHICGGIPGLASAIGILGNPYHDYTAAFSAESEISLKQGLQTDAFVRYVRLFSSRASPQTSNIQKKHRNETAFDDLGNTKNYQTSIDTYDRQTQSMSPFQETQAMSPFQETQAMSPFQQTQSNGFRSQAQNNPSNDQTKIEYSQGTQVSGTYDSEFSQILKVGIRLSDPVLSDVLQVHSSLVLGPIGSHVGALAGAILASAGKLATTHSSPVHDFRQGLPYYGVLERAILGEAAFTVVMSMKRRVLEEKGIFATMTEVVNKLNPSTKRIAPYVMHILTAPALRIALSALSEKSGISSSGFEGKALSYETPEQQFTPSNGILEPEAETFLKRLSAYCVNQDESKGSPSGVDRIRIPRSWACSHQYCVRRT